MSVHKIEMEVSGDEKRLVADVVSAELLIKTLDNCKNHEHVIIAMRKLGYNLSKSGLDREMKSLIESSESQDGIPEWVRMRARTVLHD